MFVSSDDGVKRGEMVKKYTKPVNPNQLVRRGVVGGGGGRGPGAPKFGFFLKFEAKYYFMFFLLFAWGGQKAPRTGDRDFFLNLTLP